MGKVKALRQTYFKSKLGSIFLKLNKFFLPIDYY